MTIGPSTSIGRRPHYVSFENPGAPIPDGDGGYTPGPVTIVGRAFVRIQPATGGDQERVGAGTVLSRQSYIVSAPYLPGLTTETVMRFPDARVGRDRLFTVTSVTDDEEAGANVTIVCDEILR